jgi:uncharacterized protein YggT (Ycf19 family)
MNRTYISNNDQEGVFEQRQNPVPGEEIHEEEVVTKTSEPVPPQNSSPNNAENMETKRTERYYTSSIAPAVSRPNLQSETTYEDDYLARVIIQFIYAIGGILNILLGIRFLLMLFGANQTGIVQAVYNLTDPLVAPFRGIFGDTTVPQGGTFETESLLAILTISVLTYIAVSLLRLATRNVQA